MSRPQPKLILLPGLDGTGRFFARLQLCLGDRIPLQVVSYPTDSVMEYDDLLPYVESQIGTGPAVLLGESFSGPLAIKLAALHPAQIKGLILAATFVKSPWPRWMILATAAAKPTSVPRGWIDTILRGPESDPELAAEISDIMANFNPAVRAARLRTVASANAIADLKRVQCPILVVHGRSDWLVPKSGIIRAMKSKPGAVIKLIDGPHMLLQRNAAGAAREIEDFLYSIIGTP
jgi:pimeloyl-ACP methyl ester carboxylesterase